jgi:hypothetical protein
VTRHYASRDGIAQEFHSRSTGPCEACGALEAPTDPPVVMHQPECRIASIRPETSIEKQAMIATGAVVVGDVWARCVPEGNPRTIMVGLVSRLEDGAMMVISMDASRDAAEAILKAHRRGCRMKRVD